MSYQAKFVIILAIVAASTALLLNWARARTGQMLDGTAQWAFEKSQFFPNAKCSESPWWLDPGADGTEEIYKRWEALGKPPAARIIFVGDVSEIGRWGHLGQYWRQVRPRRVIDVLPLKQACQH